MCFRAYILLFASQCSLSKSTDLKRYCQNYCFCTRGVYRFGTNFQGVIMFFNALSAGVEPAFSP